MLARHQYIEDNYLISLDGTEYFSSAKIHCPNCCTRKSRNAKTTYYHQALCASLVHPEKQQVIARMPEPICQQDGRSKKDCEQKALRRWLEKFRQDHPQLKVTLTAEG